MDVLLMMMGGIGGDYTYLEELFESPPPGVSYKKCFPDTFKEHLKKNSLGKVIDRADLIHLHSWFPPCDNDYTLQLFKNINKPLVCSFATSIWDCHTLYWDEKPYLKMFKWFLLSRKLKPADLIAWSQHAKKRVVRQFAYNGKKIHVVPPLIKIKSRAHTNHHDSKINIGFIGADFERKGGYLLLDVFKILKKEFPNIYLHIVSDKTIGAVEGVSYLGQIKRQELNDIFFPNCDIFVLPTQADVYSMASLEAMSHGIPVITTSIYAMSEIIDNGKNGFLVPPNNKKELLDKIHLLINDKELRSLLGRNAKQKIMNTFSPDIVGVKLANIYKDCLKQ